MIRVPYIKIIMLLTIVFIGILGWDTFDKLSYNRDMEQLDILDYIPYEKQKTIILNENYLLDTCLLFNSPYYNILDDLKDAVIYPLLVVTFEGGESLILSRAGVTQRNILKKRLSKLSFGKCSPIIKNEDDFEFLFYNLSNEQFVVAVFYKGLFILGENYRTLKSVLKSSHEKKLGKHPFLEKDYLNRAVSNGSVVYLFSNDTANYILKCDNYRDKAYLEGKYFEKDRGDESNVSEEQIKSFFNGLGHTIDSVSLGEQNIFEIWINNPDRRVLN